MPAADRINAPPPQSQEDHRPDCHIQDGRHAYGKEDQARHNHGRHLISSLDPIIPGGARLRREIRAFTPPGRHGASPGPRRSPPPPNAPGRTVKRSCIPPRVYPGLRRHPCRRQSAGACLVRPAPLVARVLLQVYELVDRHLRPTRTARLPGHGLQAGHPLLQRIHRHGGGMPRLSNPHRPAQGGIAPPAHPDGRVGRLEGLGSEPYDTEGEVPASEAGGVLGPQGQHHPQVLVGAAAPLLRGHPQGLKLVGCAASAYAEDDPSPGQGVQGCNHLGHDQGIPIRHHHDGGPQLEPGGEAAAHVSTTKGS